MALISRLIAIFGLSATTLWLYQQYLALRRQQRGTFFLSGSYALLPIIRVDELLPGDRFVLVVRPVNVPKETENTVVNNVLAAVPGLSTVLSVLPGQVMKQLKAYLNVPSLVKRVEQKLGQQLFHMGLLDRVSGAVYHFTGELDGSGATANFVKYNGTAAEWAKAGPRGSAWSSSWLVNWWFAHELLAVQLPSGLIKQADIEQKLQSLLGKRAGSYNAFFYNCQLVCFEALGLDSSHGGQGQLFFRHLLRLLKPPLTSFVPLMRFAPKTILNGTTDTLGDITFRAIAYMMAPGPPKEAKDKDKLKTATAAAPAKGQDRDGARKKEPKEQRAKL